MLISLYQQIQDLTDKHTAKVDEIMSQVKKEFAKV
jgi:ribosome recycling factor